MPKKRKVNIGDQFGEYTIISQDFYDEDGYNKILVQCKCGRKQKKYFCSLKRLTSCKSCSSKKYRKYTPGDKIFSLTFIKYADHEKNYHPKYLVQCDCGKTIIITTFGSTKTCGCILKKTGINNSSYIGTKDISGTYFSQIKLNAKKRKLKFNLNINFLQNLFEKQNKKCALTNLVLNKDNFSLDRVDSSKGYTKDNVQWVHKDVNRIKSDFNEKYFIQICKLISNHNKETEK